MSSTSSITAECDPLKLTGGASISATCGVFVEPGKVGGSGTQAAPFGTLAEALGGNPMNLPIYVCSTGAGLDEAATLSGSERLLGGVTCGDWKATATKTARTAASNATPLTLSNTTGALVQGFAITSAAASGADGATLQGNSSIAVLADNATATLESVDVVAGAGAAGGEGKDEAGQAPGAQSAASSFNGNVGAGCDGVGGPAKAFSMCPAGGVSQGGKGGDGGNLTGNPGSPGVVNPGLGNPDGQAGNADSGSSMWSCGSDGGAGELGHDGPNGGPGAGGMGPGTLSSTGFVGAGGMPGAPGTTGQGGGGGGGRDLSGCGTVGPSGGSGAAGGCGGMSGAGGGAGGASIALASINSTLSLANVRLTAEEGGPGVLVATVSLEVSEEWVELAAVSPARAGTAARAVTAQAAAAGAVDRASASRPSGPHPHPRSTTPTSPSRSRRRWAARGAGATSPAFRGRMATWPRRRRSDAP